MRPELWPRVTDLMHRAIDVPEEVRRTWIETEAGGDAELVAEVVRLLDAHAEAGRFLDDPLIAQAGAIAALRDAIGDRRPQLAIGQHLGPFVLEAPLGAGGMGEVWRARDTALGRTVAIKVLAAEFSGDAERLHRFEQEARAAGLINHPNILTVHAVGSHDGFPYLVTELLEGETLKERLAGGAIPPRKAVDLAVQIARGLGAAHERGIVHRDLKPANLFVTTDGRLKILDFGLAKLRAQQDIERDEAHSVSGTVLGTAGYMAPEQVRGQAVDHRADIFALGVVLYEMLAGRRAFDAPSAVETMHQILTAEPAPLEGIDPAIVRIVEHCLEKNAGERFQAARDLAFHLEAARPTTDSAAPVRGPMPSRGPAAVWLRRSLPWLLAASAVAFAVWLRTGDPARAPLSEAPLRRFAVSLAASPLHADRHSPLAVSPDGRRIAYLAEGSDGAQIMVRDLDALTARPIAGGGHAFGPFFSSDGQHLGFFTSDSLMRVSLAGGEPARLAATSPVSRGGVWGDDGYIYFAPSESAGILRIAADGGVPEPVTQAVVTAGVQTQVWPDLSPGADVLLYVVPGDSEDEARIVARSLRTGRERTIVEGGTSPRAAPGGLVTFARGDTIFAVDFDAGALEARGIPRPLLSGVQMSPLFGSSYYAVSREGTLVYAPGDARPLRRALLWVTPSGEESPGFVEERPFLFPAISPDGNSVAITIEGAHQDLWRFEVGQPVLKRLTTAPSQDFGPVWSRDGTRLAFTSVKHGQVPAAFVKPADRSDEESHLAAASFPNVWSLAGDAVIVTTERGEANRRAVPQLLAVPLDRSEPPRPVLASRFSRYGAAMSPDGRRLAYVSLETGRAEVFVATDGSNVQVSIGGGTSPIWSRDGRQLFYRNGDAVLSVAVGSTTGLWPEPRVLFRGRFEEPGRHDWPRNYDVAPDGRFLMIRQTYAPAPRELVVVLDWRGQALRAPD